MKLLVINPNTSASVTDMVLAACRNTQPQLQWDVATATFGAPYIASESSYAVAAHAVLDAFCPGQPVGCATARHLHGAAALTGLGPGLQSGVTVPVLDNVLLGAQAVADAVAAGR